MLWVATSCLMRVLVAGPPATAACDDPGLLRYEPRTFLGYACEGDCQRHKAGFRWAEWHLVTDSRRCVILPKAESEGCVAFLEEGRQAEAAGERWAIENEIAHQCDCRGAGERFFAGCARQLPQPINTYKYLGNCDLRKPWTRSRFGPKKPAAKANRR